MIIIMATYDDDDDDDDYSDNWEYATCEKWLKMLILI